MIRRDVLKSLAALAVVPAASWADEPGLRLSDEATPFDAQTVVSRARALAAEPYAPRPQIPASWRELSYDQYRKIWFDGRNALWENTDAPQRVDVFPPGLYFPQAVALNVVENGNSRAVRFDMGVFDTTDKFPDVEIDETLGYSGLRLRAELEQSGIFQEYAVFQGASYFRGIGTGEIYGLSARGLALKTGDPMGEEFPDFTAFWMERPAPDSDMIVLHALLDSPSCSGAYRFEITHGNVLEMKISATLFAREDMNHVGIAPLTSMFLFDDTMRQRFSDFRPAVHDSDGLLIHNGGGEVIWRPLSNPTTLQISAFSDNNPRGFGLCQRKRQFSDFNDLEALYHNRPAVWITPGEDWGQGAITLVEIPADLEIYDNIVSYWRPAAPILAGTEHSMSYTLHWGADPVAATADVPVKVINTALGGRPEGGQIIAVDFAASPRVPDDLSTVEIILRSSTGSVTPGIVQRNPETKGPRLAFTFNPGDASLVEFRAQLRVNGEPLSEVWLYRWTRA
ncbi:Glucans biosynthesis protein G [Sulfitobacter noctilucicola]|uniref:Glucans biosynthesis protein n=1 Tax=Sulfitobacter noctilucicola TaxID=1342301 RepID=A0A7W6M728_9RHOB|nr:glucan biosynthesis protein G [Sulfitobacter noctilucicola]KIN61873.1 Glucans biosynthesis protein G [Sulfitobacter noctilucicola]MBB4173606.1 glucans biosynthesis protein [Sulfitobacter noctilucicola]